MNYRVERVYVALREPVAGLDPLKAVDPVALADCNTNLDAQHLGLRPLSDFYVPDFDEAPEPYVEPRRWFKATAGLKTVRGLLRHYRQAVESGQDILGREPGVLLQWIGLLETLEGVLAEAHAENVRFCLLAKDLA